MSDEVKCIDCAYFETPDQEPNYGKCENSTELKHMSESCEGGENAKEKHDA